MKVQFIEASVFVKYMDEVIDVMNAHNWIFIIDEKGYHKAALYPYSRYWDSLDDGK
jgi:hypothetical protein